MEHGHEYEPEGRITLSGLGLETLVSEAGVCDKFVGYFLNTGLKRSLVEAASL